MTDTEFEDDLAYVADLIKQSQHHVGSMWIDHCSRNLTLGDQLAKWTCVDGEEHEISVTEALAFGTLRLEIAVKAMEQAGYSTETAMAALKANVRHTADYWRKTFEEGGWMYPSPGFGNPCRERWRPDVGHAPLAFRGNTLHGPDDGIKL